MFALPDKRCRLAVKWDIGKRKTILWTLPVSCLTYLDSDTGQKPEVKRCLTWLKEPFSDSQEPTFWPFRLLTDVNAHMTSVLCVSYKDDQAMKKAIVSVIIIGVFVLYAFIHAQSGLTAVVPNTLTGSRSSSSSATTTSPTEASGATVTPNATEMSGSLYFIRTVRIREVLPMRNGEWCRSKQSLRTGK